MNEQESAVRVRGCWQPGRPAYAQISRPLRLMIIVILAGFGSAVAAEPATDDADAEHQSSLVEETPTPFPFSFDSTKSVEGTLAETAQRQSSGLLERFRARQEAFKARTGLSYGFDNFTQYLGTNSDKSPSDSASNAFRFYGTWTLTGRDTPVDGALVFKIEDRSAIGNKLSPQALGPSLGYAGLFSVSFSDAGVILTNFYWRQHFAAGRGTIIVGQVDPSDYISVNNIASPWTGFTNLAFEQLPTLAIPSQGLGAAVLWRLDEHWGLLAGLADANGDPSNPFESAKNLFDKGELFKHIGIGWTPDWSDRYDQTVQLTLWQADERVEAGVEKGHGVDFLSDARIENWLPFVRMGYAKNAGVLNNRSVSIGTGYEARGGVDLAGLAVGWARAPGSSRNQYTLEAFYRYDISDFLQVTPEIQYIVNPAFDPTSDQILVLGLRLRVFL